MRFVFPIAIIALNIGAGIIYGIAGDWRRAVYWIAAAVLTTAVTMEG